MNSFCNRKILVTGASSGIGKATAYYLAGLEATIVAVDINQEGLNELKTDFNSKGYPIICIAENLQSDNLERIFTQAISDGVKLNGLVHCAGINSIISLSSLTKQRLHCVLEINFYSFVELVRLYSKKKYSNKGSIVGISSLAAIQPRPYELAYITSKAALNAAIPCLAIELASKQIRVNGIMPGVVNTGMINTKQTTEQKDFVDNMSKRAILGAAQQEDIASVVAFLLSDNSKIITGRIISADGGIF